MKDFTFADETLDLNRSESYKLSIQVDLNGFSFSILDTVRNKFIMLSHFNLEDKLTQEDKGKKIEQILEKDKHLQYPFKKVSCLTINPNSILMPSALFKENSLKKLFEFNYPINGLDEIHYTFIDQLDAYNVFTIPNPISNALIKKFNKIQFYHYTFPLIFYHLNFIHTEKTNLGLTFYEDFIDIIASNKEQKLLFSNSFHYQNKEDILYYILSVYKQLNLDPSVNELIVTRANTENKQIITFLKNYIKKINELRPPKDFTYSYTFKKDILSHYTNLFRLNLCV